MSKAHAVIPATAKHTASVSSHLYWKKSSVYFLFHSVDFFTWSWRCRVGREQSVQHWIEKFSSSNVEQVGWRHSMTVESPKLFRM